MSSLAERYKEIPIPVRQCGTCRWFEKLDGADQEFFVQKMSEDERNIKKLWKACRANGLQASYTSFRGHVNEDHTDRGAR